MFVHGNQDVARRNGAFNAFSLRSYDLSDGLAAGACFGFDFFHDDRKVAGKASQIIVNSGLSPSRELLPHGYDGDVHGRELLSGFGRVGAFSASESR